MAREHLIAAVRQCDVIVCSAKATLTHEPHPWDELLCIIGRRMLFETRLLIPKETMIICNTFGPVDKLTSSSSLAARQAVFPAFGVFTGISRLDQAIPTVTIMLAPEDCMQSPSNSETLHLHD
jgi:hypothetical protein